MTNDRRMVPGPSDEEIERFRLDYFNDLPLHSSEFRSVLKYALARWCAQGKRIDGVWRCQCCGEMASPTDSAFRWTGELWQHSHPEAQTSFDCSFFGAQTEYDPVKVEALLKHIEFVTPESVRAMSTTYQLAVAVRSSRRPRGRVVEGDDK